MPPLASQTTILSVAKLRSLRVIPITKIYRPRTDTESGLDNFGARYFSSNRGRFMIPDWDIRPTAVPYAKIRRSADFKTCTHLLKMNR